MINRLISKGGGIFSRASKKIPLSAGNPGAARVCEGEDATPQAVMTAILKAKVDLLWFGGIGTYLRATDRERCRCG